MTHPENYNLGVLSAKIDEHERRLDDHDLRFLRVEEHVSEHDVTIATLSGRVIGAAMVGGGLVGGIGILVNWLVHRG